MTNQKDCTDLNELMNQLQAPFPAEDIEWRVRAKRFLINR